MMEAMDRGGIYTAWQCNTSLRFSHIVTGTKMMQFFLATLISCLIWGLAGAVLETGLVWQTRPWLSDGNMSKSASARSACKRAAPPEVAPVVIDSVSYSVLHFGLAEGLEQNGGYIVATDRKSGKRLWLVKMYDNKIDPNLERDVQDVFIRSLKKQGKLLEATDEKGRQYLLDPKTRQVRPRQ
jgi:hypothetical protein